MSKSNWIETAKIHFNSINEGEEYQDGDEKSEKSKEINKELQEVIDNLFQDSELVIDKSGNKWGIQGHKKLSNYIWYRIYLKELGREYPLVINVSIDSKGLNCNIDIYDNKVNEKVQDKYIAILKDIYKDNTLTWDENNNYGLFNLDELTQDNVNKVIQAYKDNIYKINETIFNHVVEEFNRFLETPSDIPHLNFNKNGEFYKNAKNIKSDFDTFLDVPTYKNLEWWDESINSAQMQGNRTNLIKKLEGLTLDEVRELKDESELQKIKETFIQIRSLIFENENVKENLTFQDLTQGIQEIEGMNATAQELAYYIQLDENQIPLVNTMTTDVIKYIEKLTKLLSDKELNSFQSKIDKIKNIIKIPQHDFEFKSYYALDQFLNLLHKVSSKELSQTNNSNLYQYAYLFANLLGKADKKGVAKDDFIETLRKGKNIIFYGAPGTGKTFSVRSNIENIVENDEKQFVMTQFHPSYSYEDFIEGVKPSGLNDGKMNFELKDGEFKIFCDKAKIDEEEFLKESNFSEAIKKYGFFFFVDEINRAELSRVFGELLYSLEYRGKSGKLKTQYSSLRDENEYFYIPENLFLIGTMNDVDRSIDSFDLALRRRFIWIRKDCDYEVIENEVKDEKGQQYRKACENLNNYVIKIDGLGEKYQIGHAYFLKVQSYIKNKITQSAMNDLFDYHLEPLLAEYLRVEYDENGIKQHINEARRNFKLESK